MGYKLPNDFRCRILGNYEILEKSQIWFEAGSGAPSPFHKLNIRNSSQKVCNFRYETFLDLHSFPGFLYFLANILSGIV